MNRNHIQRTGPRLLALMLILCLLGATLPAYAAESEEKTAFRYWHDPRLNSSAMADIIVNPDAVYGFSPSPDGSLKQYASFDWTDPELVNGEDGRIARIAYHESIEELYTMLDEMTSAGRSVEDIARAVNTKRNELRLAAYDDDPEGLATAKARNLERYGREEGPLPDELYEQYGSWEVVIEKAFSTNSGMDACLGLYDDYYDLYVAAGQIKAEDETVATREYVVASIADAIGLTPPATAGALNNDFSDSGALSAWYAPEMAAAISAGVINGYEDGTLRPQSDIHWVELVVIVSRCLSEIEETRDAVVFTDVPDWAQPYVDHLTRIGFLEDDGDGLMNPDRPVTVEQVNDWSENVESFLWENRFWAEYHEATAEDEEKFQELVAANDFAAILSRHDSVTVTIETYSGEETVDTQTLFADAKRFAQLDADFACTNTEDSWLEYYGADDQDLIQILAEDGGYADQLEYLQAGLSLMVPSTETLLYANRFEDAWYMSTQISDGEYVQQRMAQHVERGGEARDYQEGMAIGFMYCFDAETLDLVNISTFLSDADGVEELIAQSFYSYDEPLDLTETELSPYFTAEEDSLRTITVVFDADTATKHTETWRVPTGICFDIKVNGEWAKDFYTDPECTQVYDYEGRATDDGVTVYVRADGT